ncbi:hypothetical protein SAMN04487911_14811 [Arenibacter nanhaiticus]|uniref:Uncharacterized protein n=1 Tax=Arenibacter nanhaiticus TaxID=558155 RepID=A0A1M6MV95_9FLAO|nr:hypothetical protein [Arenibacter nanhaiticus]SHJ87374.1 hypothetical protein SAMN04487911_14811 [Arenibacter nanhaiticus]
MGLDDLLTGSSKEGAKPKKKAAPKKAAPASEEKKEYKNIYLSESAIKLLHQVTFLEKVNNSGYTFGDAVHEGLKLLAKKKGL